jgi:hypothetical protein
LRKKCRNFFRVFFRIFSFCALPSVGHYRQRRLCQVPDKRLSANKALPIGFLPRPLYRELRSAKALPRALEALPRAGTLGKAASSRELQDIYPFKANTFPPPNLASKFDYVAVNVSYGGIVTAWDPKMFNLSNTLKHSYNLTVALRSLISENFPTITNVYASSPRLSPIPC